MVAQNIYLGLKVLKITHNRPEMTFWRPEMQILLIFTPLDIFIKTKNHIECIYAR